MIMKNRIKIYVLYEPKKKDVKRNCRYSVCGVQNNSLWSCLQLTSTYVHKPWTGCVPEETIHLWICKRSQEIFYCAHHSLLENTSPIEKRLVEMNLKICKAKKCGSLQITKIPRMNSTTSISNKRGLIKCLVWGVKLWSKDWYNFD